MSMLSPRLQVKVAQKQILTPGLVQMVTVLQLNRLELRDLIVAEINQNPVLEESADGVEELTPAEVQAVLEAERVHDPSDRSLLDAMREPTETDFEPADLGGVAVADHEGTEAESAERKPESDPFDDVDFGTHFEEYLDPGYKSPSSENI